MLGYRFLIKPEIDLRDIKIIRENNNLRIYYHDILIDELFFDNDLYLNRFLDEFNDDMIKANNKVIFEFMLFIATFIIGIIIGIVSKGIL